MSRFLCMVGLHRWHKWGGTRTTGLFRRCVRCSQTQEGVEGRRCIHWIDSDSSALARVGGAK